MTHKQLGAKVDPEFEATVARYSWSLSHGYARHYKKVDGVTRNLFSMQELVWSLAHGVTVKRLDHINGDRLDNRVTNLRPSTGSLQSLNTKRRVNKKSGLPKGVWSNKHGRFPTSITHHGKTYNIGTFDTPEAASEAYERNLSNLIEYEAAVARGEEPEKPKVLVGLGPRKRGGRGPGKKTIKNQESLQAALDFFGAAVVSEDLATQPPSQATQPSETREERGCVAVAAVAGGKHAATVPPGDLTLSSDQIMDAWHQAWGQA